MFADPPSRLTDGSVAPLSGGCAGFALGARLQCDRALQPPPSGAEPMRHLILAACCIVSSGCATIFKGSN